MEKIANPRAKAAHPRWAITLTSATPISNARTALAASRQSSLALRIAVTPMAVLATATNSQRIERVFTESLRLSLDDHAADNSLILTLSQRNLPTSTPAEDLGPCY